jgi:hypothetical protein
MLLRHRTVTTSPLSSTPLPLFHHCRSMARPGHQVPRPGRAAFARRGGEVGEPPEHPLPHGLNSSGGVPEPDGPASGDGSVGGDGGGVARVGEVGGVVSVYGASGPWGRPRGPMEMCAVQRITGAPMGPETTVMRHSSSSSSLPSSSLDGSMTRALGLVQLGWGNPNCGWHTTSPGDPMERRRGPRAPSDGKPIGQGKGTGTSPTHDSVAWPKAAVVVVVQGRVWAVVAPSSMATMAAVAWRCNCMNQCKDQIGKSS